MRPTGRSVAIGAKLKALGRALTPQMLQGSLKLFAELHPREPLMAQVHSVIAVGSEQSTGPGDVGLAATT